MNLTGINISELSRITKIHERTLRRLCDGTQQITDKYKTAFLIGLNKIKRTIIETENELEIQN